MALGHNAVWVLPGCVNLARDNLAAEIDVDLMKAALGVVKFIHKARLPHGHSQPRLFINLTLQIVGQRGPCLNASARRAKQIMGTPEVLAGQAFTKSKRSSFTIMARTATRGVMGEKKQDAASLASTPRENSRGPLN